MRQKTENLNKKAELMREKRRKEKEKRDKKVFEELASTKQIQRLFCSNFIKMYQA